MIDSLARFVYHEIDLKEQFAESKRQGVKHWDSRVSAFSEWLIPHHLMQQVEGISEIFSFLELNLYSKNPNGG